MSPALWLLAGLAAVALAAWSYGVREERVSGRVGPAALRAVVVFLLLAGLALPSLRGGTLEPPARVVLLDVSRSMALPARAGVPAAPSRIDSARAVLAGLSPDRVLAFGTTPRPVRLDSVAGLRPEADRSRLAPAIEAAALGGADSVWVLTDGDLADRDEAVALAADLGLGLREVRVAEPVARVGIAALRMPERARAGDTVRAAVEVRAGGEPAALPDSVTVEIRLDEEPVALARAARPGPGRASRIELPFVPQPGDEPVWRRYVAVLVEPGDPLEASDRAAAWIEVSEASGGAVFVSMRPDWEARFLVPSLERLVLGGSRGFLALGDGRYLEMAPRPRLVEEGLVRRALRDARLLAVQGAPRTLPDWLAAALRSHPRTLVLVEGPGDIPGSGLRASGPLPGEWYPSPPVPPSPAAGLLRASDLEALPPAREVYALDRPARWTILAAARDRRGEARPLLVAGGEGARRWAVATTSEWWRWALREGAPRRVYDGSLSGVVGWLVEDAAPRLATLASPPTAGEPLAWRVRPGVRELTATIVDDVGTEVWSRSWAEPPATIAGPALEPGRYEARVEATGPEGAFDVNRPVEIVPAPAELLAGPPAPLARLVASRPARVPGEARAPRPVWPFVLAVALLCAEWIWRHRIGLR